MSEGHSFFDREGKGDVTAFLRSYLPGYEATRAKGYVCLTVGNHDIARLGNNRTDDELEMLTAFGLTMPGVPFLYYGTEIGMRQLGNDLPQVEGAYKPRAGARTPMQWAPGANLGFSAAAPEKLYLPVDAARRADRGGAGGQSELAAQPYAPAHPTQARGARAGRLRRVRAALCGAQHLSVRLRPRQRALGVLVAFNPAARPVSAEFGFTVANKGFELLAGRAAQVRVEAGRRAFEMAAQSYAIYRVIPAE
jgi:maltose alpha-D-glucosyltransferase/alpha-amylase